MILYNIQNDFLPPAPRPLCFCLGYPFIHNIPVAELPSRCAGKRQAKSIRDEDEPGKAAVSELIRSPNPPHLGQSSS